MHTSYFCCSFCVFQAYSRLRALCHCCLVCATCRWPWTSTCLTTMTIHRPNCFVRRALEVMRKRFKIQKASLIVTLHLVFVSTDGCTALGAVRATSVTTSGISIGSLYDLLKTTETWRSSLLPRVSATHSHVMNFQVRGFSM